jgi:hypothetical protein
MATSYRMRDPLAYILSLLTPVLDALGIRYAVVGSLASSAHGVFRATADGDLLARVTPLHARQLASALGKDWYADAEAIERAIRAGRSFNLIHIPTAMKVDIFPATTEFHETQMGRATAIPVFRDEDAMRLPVASAEDVLLSKLQWYQAGGEVSEKQWGDVTGVLATNTALDFNYLESWAQRLGVSHLLARAIADRS